MVEMLITDGVDCTRMTKYYSCTLNSKCFDLVIVYYCGPIFIIGASTCQYFIL